MEFYKVYQLAVRLLNSSHMYLWQTGDDGMDTSPHGHDDPERDGSVRSAKARITCSVKTLLCIENKIQPRAACYSNDMR